MAPGEIVYYESARCLHARMRPLQARTYANLFVHYRPTDDPDWFTKPNPPGAPTPSRPAASAKEVAGSAALFDHWRRVGNIARDEL
jgi:hypothetical protein